MNNTSEDGKNCPPGQGQVIESNQVQLKDLPIAELMKRLDAPADALSKAEAQQRLQKYGYNEIEEKRVSPILKFLSYFWGPIPIIIMIAAILLRHSTRCATGM